MTTSQGTGKPAERPAGESEAVPGTQLSRRAAADADGEEMATLTGSVAPIPDDPQQLEAEIERTREQLGETIQELVARTDVKSLARVKAAELTGSVRNTTVQARQNAAARAASARSQVADKMAAVRNRAAAVGAPVWEATPEPVRRAVTKGASGARERWIPLAAAAGVLIAGYLTFRQLKTRSSDTAGMS
jgi:hypothetical protein